MTLREKISRRLSPLLDVALRSRTTVKFFLTLGIFISANHFAWLIRFEFNVPPGMVAVMWQTIPVLVIAKALGFLASGQFSGWWRYVSIRDVLPIAAGSTLGSVLFVAAVWGLWGPTHLPRSIYLLDWVNTMVLVLGTRYIIRMGREGLGRRRHGIERRVLIIGAGAAGQMIAREIAENTSLGMQLVGFVDDAREKIGTRIHGVKVLGGHGQIGALCGKYRIDEIIIAIPSASPSVVRHIVEHCREVSATFRILPGIGDLIDGKVNVRSLRNVDLEDLLGRDPVALDAELLAPPHHGAHGDGDRCGGVDRFGAVPPDRAAVAGAADPVRDRGEPAVLLRDGDAGEVPGRGPGPGDRRRARPGKGRGDRPRPSSRDHLPRGGVQARADDGEPSRGGGEDERSGDTDHGGGGREVRGGAVRPRLDGQGGAPDERDGGDEAAGGARDPQHRYPEWADGVRRRPVRQRPRQRGERDPDLPQATWRPRGS